MRKDRAQLEKPGMTIRTIPDLLITVAACTVGAIAVSFPVYAFFSWLSRSPVRLVLAALALVGGLWWALT